MDPLSWTGAVGTLLNPALFIVAALFGIAVLTMLVLSFFAAPVTLQSNADGSVTAQGGLFGLVDTAVRILLFVLLAVLLAYIVSGIVMPYGQAGIIGAVAKQFTPVWICLVATFVVSIHTMYVRSLPVTEGRENHRPADRIPRAA